MVKRLRGNEQDDQCRQGPKRAAGLPAGGVVGPPYRERVDRRATHIGGGGADRRWRELRSALARSNTTHPYYAHQPIVERQKSSISLTCMGSAIGSNWNSVETKTVYRKLAAPLRHRQAPGLLGLQTTAPEVFIPAFAARGAAHSRPAAPPTLAVRPTVN